MAMARLQSRSEEMSLEAEGSRILFVCNLPRGITLEDLHDTFGSFGAIEEIKSRHVAGSVYVLYGNANDAERARAQKNGSLVGNRFIVVTSYPENRVFK